MRWKLIHHEGQRLRNVGIASDGSLYNPHGYAEELVRAALAAAEQRQRERRSKAAKKAAATRALRRERRVDHIVETLRANGQLVPSGECRVCGKQLADSESIARGIGSDCWQQILTILSQGPRAGVPA